MSALSTATAWPEQLIDLDRLIGIGQAANLLRRWTGRPTNPATVWRWSRTGRHGVLLPHVRVGRGVFTTEAAVRWWLAETTAAEVANAAPRNGVPRPAMLADDLAEQLEAEGL